MARIERDPGEIYRELTHEFGAPFGISALVGGAPGPLPAGPSYLYYLFGLVHIESKTDGKK